MGFSGGLKLLLVSCLAGWFVSCSNPGASVPCPRPDGNFAWKHAVETANIIPRYSGSPGAEKAAARIASVAKSLPGFRVSVDLFRDMTPEGEKTFRNVIAELPGTTEEFLRCFGVSSLGELPAAAPEKAEAFRQEARKEAGFEPHKEPIDIVP